MKKHELFLLYKEVDKYHILAVEFLKNMIEKFIKTSSYEEIKNRRYSDISKEMSRRQCNKKCKR